MNENRKIGFEVLENADETRIKEMGADTPILTQNAKDRMLKMSKEKFNKEKGITATENTDTENDEYTVSGEAETYKRSKIKRVITAVASCAAAAVLIGTTALLLHKKPDTITPEPDQNITTNADPKVTNTGTTVTRTGTNKSTKTDVSKTTIVTTTTSAVKNDIVVSSVPQEELDRAKEKVINDMIHSNICAIDLQYKYIDMNSDSISELAVLYESPNLIQSSFSTAKYYLTIYSYNGSEYICDTNTYGEENRIPCNKLPEISADGRCIHTFDDSSNKWDTYLTLNSDSHKIYDVFEYGYDIEYHNAHYGERDYTAHYTWYHNDKRISESEYNSLLSSYSSYGFSEIKDYTYVTAETDGVEAERQRLKKLAQDIANYKAYDPHCDDYASVTFNRENLIKEFKLDTNTMYLINHIDTYSNGDSKTTCDLNETFSADKGDLYSYMKVYYGKDDNAKCHVKFEASPVNDYNTKIDLFEIDIDFKNKTWTPCGNNPFFDEIYVDFCYPSEYNN